MAEKGAELRAKGDEVYLPVVGGAVAALLISDGREALEVPASGAVKQLRLVVRHGLS